MSGAALIERAAAGELPTWTVAGPARRAHMGRVAALLDLWAAGLRLESADRIRWRAAGWLHDALRDEDPDLLRPRVAPASLDLPDPVLHGPAAAARLEEEGVADRSLRSAIAHHTLGHAGLDRLGRALYLADFLEPGRAFEPAWRASLAARMPESMDAVLHEVVSERIARQVRSGRPLRPETVGFWNELAAGRWS